MLVSVARFFGKYPIKFIAHLRMQGRKTNIIKFVDTLKASMNKLENKIRKVNAKDVAMFEKLSSILDVCGDDKVLPPYANNGILQHLTALKNEFDRYLPELSDDDLKLERNPFKLSVEIAPVHCRRRISGAKHSFWSKRYVQRESNHRILAHDLPFLFKSYGNSYPCIASVCVDISLRVRLFKSDAN